MFAGKITEDFAVKEHPKEAAAKVWHTAANLKQKITKGKAPVKESTKGSKLGKKSTKGKQPGKKTISMSLLTYKLHALGDYVQTIRQRGTTDSYNSQTVSISLCSELYLINCTGGM